MAPTPRSLALFALFSLASIVTASPKQTSTTAVLTSAAPAPTQALSAMTSEGCFSSASGFVDQGTYTWQSSGYCQTVCVALNKPVLALSGGNHCWCGDLLPAANTAVDAFQCNAPCLGYPSEMCGGNGNDTWTVWLTGTDNSIGSSSGSSSSSSPGTPGSSSSPPTTSEIAVASAASLSTTAALPVSTAAAAAAAVTTIEQQTVTASGSTIVRTMAVTTIIATPTSTASTKEASHSSNKAPIAAGVVVGVVVIAAILGGVYLYLRRRRNNHQESRGHRRASSLPLPGFDGLPHLTPTLPRLSTMQDSRLEHRLMMEKRQSGVSVFADNEDYSRRILKVANPDSS